MEKIKLCPMCGTRNNPLHLECTHCEADLQNVPVLDEPTDQTAQSPKRPSATSAISSPMVRVCDCGAKNPVQARRCSVCGDDISMIIPSEDPALASGSITRQYLLSSIDGTFSYKIINGRTIVGRENEMRDYLASKPYVSRKHAELILDAVAATLKIRNCNNTNYTFVNNRMISGDMPVELKDGDEIGLGGNIQNGCRQAEAAYFLVRIE